LRLLPRRGYQADVVERWIAQVGIRRDLFGCIDVVAIHPHEQGVLGVQATTAGHLSSRLGKAVALPALRTWLAAGNAFQVWGWARSGTRWRVKIVGVRAEDLAGVVVEAPRRRRGGRQWRPLPLFDPDPDGTPADR
jgi:hypothetical protein